MNNSEAKIILATVIDILSEVCHEAGTDEDIHKVADMLLRFRDEWFNKQLKSISPSRLPSPYDLNARTIKKMKIDYLLDSLLMDLENFEPDTLSSIVRFVRAHEDYNAITMLVRNTKRSAKHFLDQCSLLVAESNPISDIQLAGLLVIVADVDNSLYDELVSSTSNGVSEYHWSRAMATSYLIHREVLSETIRKSA